MERDDSEVFVNSRGMFSFVAEIRKRSPPTKMCAVRSAYDDAAEALLSFRGSPVRRKLLGPVMPMYFLHVPTVMADVQAASHKMS